MTMYLIQIRHSSGTPEDFWADASHYFKYEQELDTAALANYITSLLHHESDDLSEFFATVQTVPEITATNDLGLAVASMFIEYARESGLFLGDED